MHQCFLSTERWRDFKTQESPAERNAWVSVNHVIILKFSYSKSTIFKIFFRPSLNGNQRFQLLRFHEGLAWTVILTLRYQISPVKCLLEKRKHSKCYIHSSFFSVTLAWISLSIKLKNANMPLAILFSRCTRNCKRDESIAKQTGYKN